MKIIAKKFSFAEFWLRLNSLNKFNYIRLAQNLVISPKIRTFVPLLENDIRQQNLRHNYRENFSKCTSKFFIVKPRKHGLRKRF